MTLLKTIIIHSILLACVHYAKGQTDFDIQIKKVSDSLVNRLMKTGKKRVAVSNFLDLQGNATELGKYIAEAVSIELTNTALEVVDRSQLSALLKELKFTEDKLTKPENALKLGELAGVEFIIIGTTTMLDNTVDITIKALDIQRGIALGGQRGSVPRTDAINNLMRSTVKGENTAANVDAGRKIDTHGKSPLDDLFQASISDLREGECTTKYGNEILTLGQVCFENQIGEDLFFVCNEAAFGSWLDRNKIGLAVGARNCSTLIPINEHNNTATSRQARFTFSSLDQKRKASLVVVLDKCKVKSMVLTKKNLLMLLQ